MIRTEGGCGHKPMQRIIEVCLLVLLCGPDCEHCHGYALGERLREFGFDDSEISVSTLYRTLRGMEEAGWVTSDWAAGGPGPQRREYAVTGMGRVALDEWATALQKRRERITRVLDAYALLGREPAADANEEALVARGYHGGAHHRRGAQNETRQQQQPAVDETEKQQADTSREALGEAESQSAARQEETENLNEYWD